ncbi:MAG: enoyl-CoA hydratase [Telmatospirillum sp.]|nr:enoyl-CoA hydratase [Telmatospirillum sp.]
MSGSWSRSFDCFDLAVTDGIARLHLNRTDKANSLSLPFWRDLPDALARLDQPGDVRALVVSAEGRIFCGGLDLDVFQSAPVLQARNPAMRQGLYDTVLAMQDALTAFERARFPVIAAVQGPCIGGGLDLVAACDVCLASEAASFRIEETNLGMMADLGTLQRLPRLIPSGAARLLALTGETLSAAEAFRLGLVSRLYPDADALSTGATDVARRIAERSPLAIWGIKRSMLYARDHGVPQALDHAAALQSAILNGGDILRSIEARSRKSVPDFPDLWDRSSDHPVSDQ